jgi:hypothetical protein
VAASAIGPAAVDRVMASAIVLEAVDRVMGLQIDQVPVVQAPALELAQASALGSGPASELARSLAQEMDVCQAWATVLAWTIARASCRHAATSQIGNKDCRIDWPRAMTFATTGETVATMFVRIGRTVTTTFTIAMTIGITASGMATPAGGGTTCGTITPR